MHHLIPEDKDNTEVVVCNPEPRQRLLYMSFFVRRSRSICNAGVNPEYKLMSLLIYDCLKGT
jgi:hypothetical protein